MSSLSLSYSVHLLLLISLSFSLSNQMEAFENDEDEDAAEDTNDQFIKIFDEFRREVALFSTMQHSRIVDLKGWLRNSIHFCFGVNYFPFSSINFSHTLHLSVSSIHF